MAALPTFAAGSRGSSFRPLQKDGPRGRPHGSSKQAFFHLSHKLSRRWFPWQLWCCQAAVGPTKEKATVTFQVGQEPRGQEGHMEKWVWPCLWHLQGSPPPTPAANHSLASGPAGLLSSGSALLAFLGRGPAWPPRTPFRKGDQNPLGSAFQAIPGAKFQGGSAQRRHLRL